MSESSTGVSTEQNHSTIFVALKTLLEFGSVLVQQIQNWSADLNQTEFWTKYFMGIVWFNTLTQSNSFGQFVKTKWIFDCYEVKITYDLPMVNIYHILVLVLLSLDFEFDVYLVEDKFETKGFHRIELLLKCLFTLPHFTH